MTRRERLKEWIKTLTEDQKDTVILELTDFAIDAEWVAFYETTKVPYYDCTGENIDGSNRGDED
ncbi:hypothetical protein UFOVP1604_162 [uncultured Caudovirales phage]|uniref:Uncharacterized protein n=1 Tax=uncultured Caudovirales phage TaxID=2100421 RepID=A0A6J5SUW1_9CAUD|nr:hypothetical protein UFOVP1604_162 [uncultured Caudovirales phage]